MQSILLHEKRKSPDCFGQVIANREKYVYQRFVPPVANTLFVAIVRLVNNNKAHGAMSGNIA
jgi:hypothetical protein